LSQGREGGFSGVNNRNAEVGCAGGGLFVVGGAGFPEVVCYSEGRVGWGDGVVDGGIVGGDYGEAAVYFGWEGVSKEKSYGPASLVTYHSFCRLLV
jgi:hypothetical protein